MKGVQSENTSDVGGGKNVGWIDTGDWMSYPAVTIPSTGAYRVEYRVACGSSGGGSVQLEKAGGTQVCLARSAFKTWAVGKTGKQSHIQST